MTRLTAIWMPGALLRRDPATFSTAPSGRRRFTQRTTFAAAASRDIVKSTASHGFRCCRAKSIVSRDPPSGGPKVNTTVPSDSTTFFSVRGG